MNEIEQYERKARKLLEAECSQCGGEKGFDDAEGNYIRCSLCEYEPSVNRYSAIRAIATLLATQHPQGVPDGWVLVPVEPTDSILNNMHGRNLVYATDAELMEAWAEIIAAASSPERQ